MWNMMEDHIIKKKENVNKLMGNFIICDFIFFYNLANRIKCSRVMKFWQIFPVSLYIYLAIWMIKLSSTKIIYAYGIFRLSSPGLTG